MLDLNTRTSFSPMDLTPQTTYSGQYTVSSTIIHVSIQYRETNRPLILLDTWMLKISRSLELVWWGKDFFVASQLPTHSSVGTNTHTHYTNTPHSVLHDLYTLVMFLLHIHSLFYRRFLTAAENADGALAVHCKGKSVIYPLRNSLLHLMYIYESIPTILASRKQAT